MAGGGVAGYASQFLGRRIMIIVVTLIGFSALAAGAFCIQFGVQGALGVLRAGDSASVIRHALASCTLPYHLSSCLHLHIRSRSGRQWAGSYLYTIIMEIPMNPIHLTELSPPRSIEATGGKNFKIIVNVQLTPDYTKVQGILIGVHRGAFDESGGRDDAWIEDEEGVTRRDDVEAHEKGSEERLSTEKASA
ncbi:hypothetical protein FB45DRAFT_1066373 [Roridomyces roridus]|uniref:Uncharacterized protein n=1 Tax=Roridomyces roridus TaxID=1738132 RepID=A0AAD7F9B4_9AGAR|nr:hypothetical protein FB45DRAFT_1066373 [Roridomyces roridus]